jgi:hypothetical protein
MFFSSSEFKTKSDCAGEDQQKCNSHSVSLCQMSSKKANNTSAGSQQQIRAQLDVNTLLSYS